MNRLLLVLISVAIMLPCVSTTLSAETVVIVNNANPITGLSKRQVNKLYLGRMRVFPRTNEEIDALDQPKDSEAYRHFYRSIVHMNLAKLQRYRATYLFSGKGRVPKVLASAKNVKQYVANNPAAIGYIDRDEVDDSVKVVYSTDAD